MGFNEFVKDAAESVIYLIELGDQHGVDMVKLLNKTLNNGSTLFFLATGHSEQLALYLLKRGVKVDTLNSNFETPQFKVTCLLSFFFTILFFKPSFLPFDK